jgi:hypothetical protein
VTGFWRKKQSLEASMTPYKNLNGNSSVQEYAACPNSLTVKFKDGGTYLYTDSLPGHDRLQTMKQLAEQGRGLASFIVRRVGKDYERKWRE